MHKKTFWREPTVKNYQLILDLRTLVSQVKGKHSIARESQSQALQEKAVDIDILGISTNGDREIMQYIRIMSTSPLRIRKWSQFSQLI